MRELLIEALLSHAKGKIDKHKVNVEIYLKNSAGIGEHSDIVDSIENEISEISKYHEQIQILNEYFS